jgi:hypothetical protein
MRAVWIVLAILLVALPARPADDDETVLRIEVKTLGGTPIERANVIVRFVEGRSIAKLGRRVRRSWDTRTNTEGVVKLPAIPQGKILIQVSAKGFQTFGKEYEVLEPEKTIEIRLNPPQPQYSSHQ